MSEVDKAKEEKQHVREENIAPQKSTFVVFMENFCGAVIYLAILYTFLAAIGFPCVYYLPRIYKKPKYSFLKVTAQVEEALEKSRACEK